MRNRLTLLLLIVFEAAALVVAWDRVPAPDPVDWGDPVSWLHHTEPDAALLALGRLLVMAIAAWLLVSTLVAVLARMVCASARLPRRAREVARRAGHLTPAVVRHVVEGAVAVSLVTAAAARPAAAAPGPTPYSPARAAESRPLLVPLAPVRAGHTPAAASDPRPVATPTAAAPPAPAPPATRPGGPHLVVSGESLWSIARDRLQAHGLPDDAHAVDRYWRAVCDANRDALPSGDVNLIHPGDELDLPPVA